MAKSQPKVDAANRNKDGDYVGTEEAPQVETVNASPDPHPHQPETGHRYAEKHGGGTTTAKSDDGTSLEWVDPDAVPGTVGDDPEETIRAVYAAGGAAVREK